MNIMNQLTYKHMIQNKKRTLMTIIGIIISVAMITAVSTATVTFLDFMQRMEMQSTGDWHLQYKGIAKGKVAEIEKEFDLKHSYLTQQEGYAMFADTANDYKPYFYVEAMDDKALEKLHVSVIKGRLPQKSSEIVLPEHVLKEQTKPYKVGDIIELELGERKVGAGEEEKLLEQEDTFQKESEVMEGERLEVTKPKKSYTIVGIIERPEYERVFSPGYTLITYLDEELLSENPNVDISLMLNKVSQSIYEQGNQGLEKLGIQDTKVVFNENVLRYYGVSRYVDTFNLMVQSLQFILICIIMVGSVSLIYNSFAISITERSKQFGMLSSVGVTKKQKRNAVFFEAFSLGIISIPVGILAGLIGMWITFSCINPVFKNAFDVKVSLDMKISYGSIFIAILFSVVTILVSSYIPARRASRISAIAAIRQTKDIKLNSKQLRISKITRLIFGVEGTLAIKNLRRNKKRYRALVFSMFISLVLFNSVGSYVFYLSSAVGTTVEGKNYDIEIGNVVSESDNEIFKEIKGLENVTTCTYIQYPQGYYTWPSEIAKKYLTKEFIMEIKTVVGGTEDTSIEQALADFEIGVGYRFMDDESFRKYAEKIGTNPDEYFNTNSLQAILLNKVRIQEGYSIKDIIPFTLQEGNKVEASEEYYIEETGEFENRSFLKQPVEVKAVTTEMPDHIGVGYTSGPMTLIMPLSMLPKFEELAEEQLYISKNILLGCNNADKTEIQIKEILDSYTNKYYLYNIAAEAKRSEQLVTVFSVFAYGFITLISLICMANLCNTISTSFALRRREFAMLKSIGMTQKAFMKMIRLESMMYAVKAIVYGIPVSIIMTVWIRKSVGSNFGVKFGFPLGTYVIGIAAVLAVAVVAMFYSARKIRKENIIDGLKSENV